jgi:SIT4-associating protein SAP185/190
MPLHPASNKSNTSPFGSLWPFSGQGFGISGKDKETEDGQSQSSGDNAADEITEEPLELEASEGMLSEDGKKIDRAVQAKRRTSIEDPDDDDDVEAGEEIFVGRGGL